MNRKDFLYSLMIAGILFLLIASNIGLIFMMLSQLVIFMILYGLGIGLIMITVTQKSINKWGFSIHDGFHWIKNHIILWIMLDYHTLIILGRYIFPKDRPNQLIPEILFVIHLLITVFVIQLSRFNWYQKNERWLLSILHVVTYAIISYNFIQFIILTMQ